MKVAIVSSSIRENASTRRVSLHLLEKLKVTPQVEPILIDLTDYEYPIWKEVFHRELNPPELMKQLHDQLQNADAMIFVTPEYNGSYSLALKNMIDYFGLKIFEKKVIGVASVSVGAFGGIRSALSLQQLALAIYAFPVPQMLVVPLVQHKYDETGKLIDIAFEKNVQLFLHDFLWLTEAVCLKREKDMHVVTAEQNEDYRLH
jgi:NAD(P)H-dependent FMN reductase